MQKVTFRSHHSIRVFAFLALNFFLFAHLSQASPSPSRAPATAALVQIDSITEGNWSGVYGSDGYAIDSYGQSIPSYAQFSVANALDWTWNPDTSDPRALQTSIGGVATCWYSPSSFTIDVAFTDGATHQLALYFLDWDSQGRTETIQILNAHSNTLLNTQTVSNFTQGQYLVFNVSGHVTVNVSAVTGPNAVVSGIFFAPAVSAASAQSSASTSSATASSSSSASLTSILTASASALNFGSVAISQSSTQGATLTNSGAGNITISNVVVSGAGFSASGLPVGTLLTPGQSASLTATFDPASAGTSTGSIVISSSAGADTIALTGTGGTQQHQVDLSWASSSSPNVVGYNTYYSTVSGGPYAKLTASPVAATSYVDASVTSGMTRYYVVTSVNSINEESGYSAEVSATVP